MRPIRHHQINASHMFFREKEREVIKEREIETKVIQSKKESVKGTLKKRVMMWEVD